MEEVCTMVATTVPYQMALILVEKLTGVHVSETAVQHMIERRGKLVLEREQKQADKHTPFQDNGLPVDIQQVPDDAPQTGPEVAYLELDGVLPLTRTEAEDYTEAEKQVQLNAKADKVPGGKGRRYEIAGKEVKNAVLYDGKDCAAETPGARVSHRQALRLVSRQLAHLRPDGLGHDASPRIQPSQATGHPQ
jgi:hypothetical protein